MKTEIKVIDWLIVLFIIAITTYFYSFVTIKSTTGLVPMGYELSLYLLPANKNGPSETDSPLKIYSQGDYSHSMVAGGLELMS
jgi:hypothetical protein